MEIEVNLGMEGEFVNQAGQRVQYWRDKENPSLVRILVDGKPLDLIKHLENEMQRNQEKNKK